MSCVRNGTLGGEHLLPGHAISKSRSSSIEKNKGGFVGAWFSTKGEEKRNKVLIYYKTKKIN